ncbi:MAG TPA: transketolase [Acidimicrobiia bacterium]|nr:transketolase [Acidimicrobiia bacterium]
MTADLARLSADAIRVLSMDAVQKANSGHPGMPMGMADIAVVLWGEFLNVDPEHPHWPDRDRFLVSNGHGSMLLYSLLHLGGFDLSMDDIRNFRQWGSPTAGHPEIELERGIEMTTGPLGQGFGTGVGMALAETHLRSVFGPGLVDHYTYGLVSDGDLMEGLAAEAASLAGHWGLGKLIYLYDDNAISLEGPTDWTFTEDVPHRFESYGWHTLTVDGHDHRALREAIAEARDAADRPSLISCKTHIGYGSPNKQDTAKAHGSPLGEDEIALVRQRLGWERPPFEIPDEVYRFFSSAMDRGRQERRAWRERSEDAFGADPELAARWRAYFAPGSVELAAPPYDAGKGVATRAMSGAVIQRLAPMRPDLMTGDADLAGSTKSLIEGEADYGREHTGGRNVRYGVREHAMGAIVNGITIHGGLRAFGSTFLTFSDYMRGSVRLGALMGTPSIWVWTHDSVFLGEDGPTHQPVEHLAALRAIPNLHVIRPGDPGEVAGAWQAAINRSEGPTALIFSRQGVPVPATPSDPAAVSKGGYVVRDGADVVLVATGSERWVALAAADELAGQGVDTRVVSMPCVEAFFEQDAAYRRDVLGENIPRVSLEAGATFGWAEVVGSGGLRIGIDHFGASAPADELAKRYGLTPAAVAQRIADWLG